MKKILFSLMVPLAALVLMASPALASHAPHIPGAELSAIWVIPFACMLLSIALGPLLIPHFWEHNFGKVSVFWGLAFLIPCCLVYGYQTALFEFLHIILADYVSFIILLFALFTVAGGVRLKGRLVGTPIVNTGILAIGTVLASWMGTTGAAMLLIRPLLQANANRRYRVHTVVFFIFLVANIGGSLTPLGDPPLFLGFLRGVDFFWTTSHLFVKTLFMALILLGIYFVLDTYLLNKAQDKEKLSSAMLTGKDTKLALEGSINLVFLLGVVAAVLLSGMVKLGTFEVYGVELAWQNILRDLALLGVAGLSWVFTSKESRKQNGFTWDPILEVAKLFFGIFLSMIPAIAILKAGTNGALAPVINLVSDGSNNPVNPMFFWCTGLLSSFLDNAPTYLVFFETAASMAPEGVQQLMADGATGWATTLSAISAGAVFMGANTYIGNAPNFMVRSIAQERGVNMPSFFGYMMWSGGILVPLFVLMTFIFF